MDFLKIIYTQNSSVNHKFKYLSITLHTLCGCHKNIDRGQLENKVQFGRYQNFHAKSFLFFMMWRVYVVCFSYYCFRSYSCSTYLAFIIASVSFVDIVFLCDFFSVLLLFWWSVSFEGRFHILSFLLARFGYSLR